MNNKSEEDRYSDMSTDNLKLCRILPRILEHLLYRQGIYITIHQPQTPHERQIIKGLCMELNRLLNVEEDNLKKTCDNIEITVEKFEEIFECYLLNGIKEEINWYTILMYLLFVGEITMRCLKELYEQFGFNNCGRHYKKKETVKNALKYLDKNIQIYLMSWIEKNDGWKIFITKEPTKLQRFLAQVTYQIDKVKYRKSNQTNL